MIIAGAGSGKTRALTHRLAYLIAAGHASSWDLLALTFTNKAAREMRERIHQLIGAPARNITMGTFHSVFSRILRREAGRVGFTNEFSIYDEDDARNLIKTLLRELNYDDKRYKPRNIKHLISGAKNALVGPESFAREYVEDEQTEAASQVYQRYQLRLQKANAMDFDDLLFHMAYLLNNYPDLLYKYQHKWRYIMVDEYQDTNHAQYLITKKLAAVNENLCVVGDDAQSIYSFRGANIQNILNFRRDHPDTVIYKLERNYRSTRTIVDAAGGVIEHNEEQIPKTVFTENGQGEKIRLLISLNEQEEANKVVDTIREQRLQYSLHPSDFAILYRTNAQSRVLEDALRRAGIPYKIFGGQSFYQRKEIKDVLAYLRLAVNPGDEEALKRVINYPKRGIGAKTVQGIQAEAEQTGSTMWQIVQNADQFLSSRVAKPVKDFAQLILSFQRIASQDTAHQAVEQIARNSGILKDLHQENSVESLSRWENVQELINAAQEYTESVQKAEPGGEDEAERTDDLPGFLSEVALMTDLDGKQDEENTDYVSLMTVHGAKGLEFPCVLITGLEEGLFPLHMAMQDREDLEEERRLFYVAMTRAERLLTLSYAETRLKFGERNPGEPSRFIEEIDDQYLHIPWKAKAKDSGGANGNGAPTPPRQRIAQQNRERTNGASNRFTANGQPSQAPQPAQQPKPNRLTPVSSAQQQDRSAASKGEFKAIDPQQLKVGTRVEHPKFGVGEIVQLSEDRVIANFPRKGNTTLMLKFAKLKVLD
jgi:DNA helicase-2/ATP-dependent DNA helicase PcrA